MVKKPDFTSGKAAHRNFQNGVPHDRLINSVSKILELLGA